MEQKILQIQELLKRNLFVSAEQKQNILRKLEGGISVEKIEKLYTKLVDADEKQKLLLKKTIKKNPNFLGEVIQAGKKQERVKLAEIEKEDRLKEQIELENLEEELNSLFE